MAEQVPSIGRVVHFVDHDDGVNRHYAAIITDPAWKPKADETGILTVQALVVFPPNKPSFTTVALYSADPRPGHWHWPEYVPPKE